MKLEWSKYTLKFRQRAGTSRGVLTIKESYFLKLTDSHYTGIGECGLLKGLSVDDRPDYEARLNWLKDNLHLPEAELFGELEEFPSIQFGLEMAIRDLQSRDHIYFDTEFTRGEAGLPINGLIWMGDRRFMEEQIRKRIGEGFGVLKMKVGSLDIQTELSLLKALRESFPVSQLTIRVDANGAFDTDSVKPVLDELAKLEVHSIEQPLKPGQWQEMAAICEQSPIPVALDEELIGIFSNSERRRLISTINPPFIILKPSLIGGWRGSEEWISLAEEHNTDWWVTSALESNFGLNAIAQWNSTKNNPLPSGLGTGSLYTNNLDSPLQVRAGKLHYERSGSWDLKGLK